MTDDELLDRYAEVSEQLRDRFGNGTRPVTDADWRELREIAKTTLDAGDVKGHVAFARQAVDAGYHITRTESATP